MMNARTFGSAGLEFGNRPGFPFAWRWTPRGFDLQREILNDRLCPSRWEM